MKKVNVYLANGFEEIEAVTVIDVLRRAGVEVTTVSITADRVVRGAHDIPVTADELFIRADNEAADMLVLPGGMPGTTNLGEHEGLTELLKSFKSSGKYIAAICAAPMVIGKLGMLEGCCATCYPGFEKYLAGANTKEDSVVQHDRFITSRGPGTAIHFALKLVELLVDKATSEQLRQGMLVQ
ncbi:MAG: DJ-1 family glyoxalase III [Bacillota bacterium]